MPEADVQKDSGPARADDSRGSAPSSARELASKLQEIFQLDSADLDFGIYRILHQRHDEIQKFLEVELISQVREALARYRSADRALIEKQLRQAVKQAEDLGVDPNSSTKVKELREQLSTTVDLTALENDVFSLLYAFFSRYYKEGDFIPQRRYKEGIYSIPYEGEEVKLYWANHDQYYVKTSEYFHNYVFNLPSGRTVKFEISRPSDEEAIPRISGREESRFLLREKDPATHTQAELVLHFEFRVDPEKSKQEDLNEKASEHVISIPELKDWARELSGGSQKGEKTERSVLEKHLSIFTARNTFDYFIHKNLKDFLARELDFFIKNEVLQLDDIEDQTPEKLGQYLTKVKVIRSIAHKIIQFIAQIEEFQRKVWLKKKFVLETNYCLTVDRIPEEFYEEIVANGAQREEWAKLYPSDQVKLKPEQTGYPESMTPEFLKANQYLVVDTCHFGPDFKLRLLGAFPELEKGLDGIIVQGDNFHALRLLGPRFHERIGCVYADPPFNTSASEILYKNNYKHSSWLSLIHDRIACATDLMSEDSVICVAIDDFELPGLLYCLSELFGEERQLATVAVRSNPHGRAMASGFSKNHEYAIFFGKSDKAAIGRLPRSEEKQARYPHSDERGIYTWINFRGTGANTRRVDRPKLFYPVYASKKDGIRISNMQWSATSNRWDPVEPKREYETIILPIDGDGSERVWTLGWERAQKEAASGDVVARLDGEWQAYRKYRPHQEGAVPGTWWDDAKYSATESGTKVLKDMLGERESFTYPKSVYLVMDCLRASNCVPGSWVLDFFAGSGTTAHAVIQLNREDDGHRKFLLIEMADYVDSVILPRVKKAAFAKQWREGKPADRKGESLAFKYIRLESYEDALDNIELKRSSEQQTVLDRDPHVKEEYLLGYMLDLEARGSSSLLNAKAFDNPFEYVLRITRNDAVKTVRVDLIETFDYLLGLQVNRIRAIDDLVTVEGSEPGGKRVLVLWRDIKKVSSDALGAWFKKRGYNNPTQEFDIVYVNGDNNLEALRLPEQTWQVKLTEETFHRLMFEVD